MLLAALVSGGVFGLSKIQPEILSRQKFPKIHSSLDYIGANTKRMKDYAVGKVESYLYKEKEEAEEEKAHEAHHRLIVTSPKIKDVTVTQKYVCQIHSRRHIEIRALEGGYLEKILVNEGQTVKQGDLLFKILPVLYKARLDAEVAEAELARLKWMQAKKLLGDKVVSDQDVKLHEAELAKAEAKKELAKAELGFTDVKARFDGIIDRLLEREGSLVNEGDILTTLSDNSVMWVYFNVPEKRYLEYMAELDQNKPSPEIELELANHNKFPEIGKIGAIEAKFNNETGNIPFRADFPNPKGLLRHGQTGTILISRPLHNAVVIPQRSKFENLAKQYVYVVDKDDVVHQREITIQNELEDIYVIADGNLNADEKIVLEGIRQVRDGEKVEYEFLQPDVVLANPKNRAE
jgi:membrane fusion protein (multidrug efflux system)